MNYEDFLKQKDYVLESSGFNIDKDKLNPMLFDFQKDVVRWALAKGRACIFAECGLGKTPMQLSWAHQVHLHTGGKVLILAPLQIRQREKPKSSITMQKYVKNKKIVLMESTLQTMKN